MPMRMYNYCARCRRYKLVRLLPPAGTEWVCYTCAPEKDSIPDSRTSQAGEGEDEGEGEGDGNGKKTA